MRLLVLSCLTVMLRAADAYAPLRLYDGAWEMRMGGKAPDSLLNRCALMGRYYACEQTVNGKSTALIVFLPKDQPGQYWTNPISGEAKSMGRGDLSIDGDHWVYSSSHTDPDGKTTYYRTTNVFTGKDRIHFEVSESPDGAKWTVTNSGDESRVAPGTATAKPAK